MTFTSLEFIFIFFPLCIAGYYLLPEKCRNYFLLAASLVFYAAGEWKRMYILVAGIIVNYVFGLLLSREYKAKKAKLLILISSIIYNFGILFYYKLLLYRYGSGVILPLGLSYFTFRTVSYCLDVYWEMMPANKNIADVALYISFFPQISMGPISSYSDFAHDMYERSFDTRLFLDGVKRIIMGLFKKLVIANSLVGLVDASFNMDPASRSISLAWLGLIAYLIQLYFDFAGYSDIATGLGGMFGFTLPENFNYPYAASSLKDFWNRWHMTLGAWMKSYIYIPIFRACQGKKMKQLTCYLLGSLGVWLFSGAWHGVGMKTIYFGLYYFLFIAGERLFEDWKKARRKKLGLKKRPDTLLEKTGAHIYAAVFILIGQLLFKCQSVSQYAGYLGSMLGITGNSANQTETYFYLKQDIVILVIGGIFSFPLIPFATKRIKAAGGEKVIKALSPVVYFVLFLISLAFAFTSTYKSFVYFMF